MTQTLIDEEIVLTREAKRLIEYYGEHVQSEETRTACDNKMSQIDHVGTDVLREWLKERRPMSVENLARATKLVFEFLAILDPSATCFYPPNAIATDAGAVARAEGHTGSDRY